MSPVRLSQEARSASASHPASLQWLAPAPVWGRPQFALDAPAFVRPWVAEFETDAFLPDFLALMGGEVPDQTPTHLAELGPGAGAGTAASPFTLFQPLHQRYYLVSGSLVCRRVGLPDRRVRAADGEQTTFVLRRLTPGGEEARITAAGSPSWQAAAAHALVPGEEQLPLHPVPVAATAEPGTVAAMLGLAEDGRRTIHYGYIPVAGREVRVEPMADPVKALADLASIPGQPHEDPRLDELMGRVVLPWGEIYAAPASVDLTLPALYVILDLGDWLRRYLPALWAALPGKVGLTGALGTLYDTLHAVDVTATPGGGIPLTQAFFDLRGFLPLVTGDRVAPPTTRYSLDARPGDLLEHGRNALDQAGAPVRVPPELEGLIVDDGPAPGSNAPALPGDVYVVRLVYEHPPCRPVLSEASQPVVFARAYEDGAPARKIRIPLPDISNLRGFSRGVAFETPPGLRRVLGRVTKETLDGDLAPDPGIQLGMICSFSLQIIMLVAFVVMFIFLFLLNIVFWWLPFLKVCFPIPKRR